MARKYRITHKDNIFEAEIIKRARLSTGVDVFLLRRDVPLSGTFCAPYIVAVKSADETKEWYQLMTLNRACCMYLDMLACYA